MKPSLFQTLILSGLLGLFAQTSLSAATDAPLFGPSTISAGGIDYVWVSATIEEDAFGTGVSKQTDYYLSSGNDPLWVYGRLDQPGLALASTEFGPDSAYLQNGVFKYREVNTSQSGSWSFNGLSFTTRYQGYLDSVDLMAGTVTRTGEYESYYGNYASSIYTFNSSSWTRSGSGISSTPGSGLASVTVFGTSYPFVSSYRHFSENSSGVGEHHAWSDAFDNGSSGVTIQQDWPSLGNSVTAWHPILGGVTGTFEGAFAGVNEITWAPRSWPTLARSELWLNGRLMYWQSGIVNTAGTLFETYVPTDGEPGDTLVLSSSLQDFQAGDGSATVHLNGVVVGGYTYEGGYDTPTCEITERAPEETTPFFVTSPSVIWVEGTPYPFAYGYLDEEGNRADIYLVSGGKLAIYGSAEGTTAVVKVSFGGTLHTGEMTVGDGDSFDVDGVSVGVRAPGAPAAFWVGDVLYRRTAGTNDYVSFPTAGSTLSLGGTNPTSFTVTGTHGGTAVTGTFNPASAGILTLTKGASTVLASGAQADGRLILGSTAPAGFPPAVRTDGIILDFLGVTTDDGASPATAAYYGDTRTAIYRTDAEDPDYLVPLTTNPRVFLKIRTGTTPPLTASLTNYTAGTTRTGRYDPTTHLFQVVSGGSNLLPTTLAVDPSHGDSVWLLDRPADLPPTLMVRGQPWWFAGATPEGTATYKGFYDGQQMTLGAADAVTGARLVELMDKVANASKPTPLMIAAGVLSADRRSSRLDDGTLVLSGSEAGAPEPVTPPAESNLQTIAMDLDILGNNLSFGLLNDDASLAGAVFQFRDSGSKASLHSSISRTTADWYWWKRDAANPEALRAVMVLDPDHRLQIYAPAPASTLYPGVVLDPAGTSSFKGAVRAAPGGDITMGAYTEGPLP